MGIAVWHWCGYRVGHTCAPPPSTGQGNREHSPHLRPRTYTPTTAQLRAFFFFFFFCFVLHLTTTTNLHSPTTSILHSPPSLLHPPPPSTSTDDLSLATLDLVRDNGPRDLNGSHMSDGTNAQERILKHCKPSGHLAENVAIGPFTGKLAVAHWLVDDGLSARPHRDSILSPNMHYIGIAAGPHKSMHVMCVCTFVETLRGDAGAGAVSVSQAPTEHTSGKLMDTPDGKGFLLRSVALDTPRDCLTLWKRPGMCVCVCVCVCMCMCMYCRLWMRGVAYGCVVWCKVVCMQVCVCKRM
jgi:Cysteine-rich secretory protein family